MGNRDDIRELVNQEARTSTGGLPHHQYGSPQLTRGGSVVAGKRGFLYCCHDLHWSNAEMKQKKKGALSSEPALLPAAAQLNNRKRRFAVRPKGRPGKGARGSWEAASNISWAIRTKRRKRCCWSRWDTSTPRQSSKTKIRSGTATTRLGHLHRWIRTEGGATGYAVVWKKNQWSSCVRS